MLAVLGLLNYSCARVIAPAGGPKDTTPPRLVKTYPEQDCTKFRGQSIKLIFDKEIEVRDIYRKLVVTPQLKKLEGRPNYGYKVRGNALKLNLEIPLEEDTTYTFNFNDAIKDVTEGNVAEAPILTFSTGEDIDAMYVTGQIKYLMNDQPAPKVLVALQKVDEDAPNFLNNPPDYFTKADESGRFKLDHIRRGSYYLYASSSQENSLKIEPGIDEYGCLKDPIDLTEEPVKDVTIPILKADIRKFELQGRQPQDQYFELSFNKPVADYTLTLARPTKRFKESPTLYSHLVEEKQVIRIYNTFGLLEEDSLEVKLTAQDELKTVIEEHIKIYFRENSKRKYPTSYEFSPGSGAAINPDFVGTVTLSKPVKEVVTDHLFFVINNHNVRINDQDLHFNEHRDVITIRKHLNPEMLKNIPQEGEKKPDETPKLVLHIEEGAFITAEGDSNKSATRYEYTFKKPKEYGTIEGQVLTQAPGFIIQLLDTEYKVIEEIKNEPHYKFREIAPGIYKIRVLALRSPDATWDFGNIIERREPDLVRFYPAEIVVIANWEITGIDFYL